MFLAVVCEQGLRGEALLLKVPGASPVARDEERETEIPPRGLRGDLAEMRTLRAWVSSPPAPLSHFGNPLLDK